MASTTNPLLKQSFLTPKMVTASKTLTGTDSGTAWTNTNATADVTLTLPKAIVNSSHIGGLQYTFLVSNGAHNINVAPLAGDAVRGVAVGTPYQIPGGLGSVLTLVCLVSGYWETVGGDVFPDGITTSGPSTLAGPVTISAPSSGVALTINGAAGSTAEVIKPASGQSNIDLWAGAPNGGALIQGYDSTGTTRTGYLDFISGTGGGGGATEVALEIDGATASDQLSIVTGGTRRVVITGTGTITLNAGASLGLNLQQNGTNKIQIETNGNIGLFGASGTGQITGWGTPTGFAVISNFPGATATLVQCSEVIARIIADLKGLGLYAA